MEEFWRIYNNVCLNDFRDCEMDFAYLLEIHYYIFGDSKTKGLRCTDEKIKDKVDLLLKNTCFYLKNDLSLEMILKIINKCIAIFYMYQLFYDGNRRTCLVLQKLLLEMVNLKVKKRESDESLNSVSIPLFYDETDDIPKKVLNDTKNIIENREF